MSVYELSKAQLEELKYDLMYQRELDDGKDHSCDEITEAELYESYEGVWFSPDDFMMQ